MQVMSTYKVKKTRRNYYFVSFAIGMIYFLFHFIAREFLGASTWVARLDVGFVFLDGFFVVIFYIKDTLDEIKMRRENKPTGPSWFEHTPFIAMVALHGIVIGLVDPPSIYVTLEWIFAILL